MLCGNEINKRMYTRDGKYIDPQAVWEVDKDGYVVASFRWIIFDFKNNTKTDVQRSNMLEHR
jgi:hypothetical protein